jgi:hypothetical protein
MTMEPGPCEAFLEALARGQEPTPEARSHAEACPACRELRDLWEDLGVLADAGPDSGRVARFRERLAREGRLHPPRRLLRLLLPLAAALLLVAGGAFAGGWLLRGPAGRDSELALLRRGASGARVQAIALLGAGRQGGPDLEAALLERVRRDEATEVRLAAVEALYLCASDPGLSGRLESVLAAQERPEVQLALVDLMVALRERRAAEALRRVLGRGGLSPEVRARAEQGLAGIPL